MAKIITQELGRQYDLNVMTDMPVQDQAHLGCALLFSDELQGREIPQEQEENVIEP